MPKTNVVLKRSGSVSLFRVRINGSDVSFSSSTATAKLMPGQHILQWFVRGAPGTAYKIEITAPAEAVVSYGAVLDGAQKDGGHVWFEVKP